MNETNAVVIGLDGDMAVVEVSEVPAACGSCGSKGGCGKPAETRRYPVRNVIGARVGDAVMVAVPEGAALKAAALSYLLPLVFVFAGAAIGTAWGEGELASVAGAVLGLLAGFAVLRVLNLSSRLARQTAPMLKPRHSVIPIAKEPRA